MPPPFVVVNRPTSRPMSFRPLPSAPDADAVCGVPSNIPDMDMDVESSPPPKSSSSSWESPRRSTAFADGGMTGVARRRDDDAEAASLASNSVDDIDVVGDMIVLSSRLMLSSQR
jgi:hypothetical protein